MHSIHRRNGVLFIAVMVAAVMWLSVPGRAMWRQVLQDAGHGLVFALIAAVLALMHEPSPAGHARSFAVLRRAFLVAVVIGALTEFVQHFQPARTVSPMDLLRDAAGSALGLAVLALVERKSPSPGLRPTPPAGGRGARPVALAVALAALAVLVWSPLECATAYAQRAARFPVLVQGVRDRDLYFVRGHRATVERASLPERFRHAADGDAIHVRYTRDDLPRFELFEPTPDWRGFDVLALDLTNPGERPLALVLKVQDAAHNLETDDRLNLQLILPPTTRTTVRVSVSAIAAAPATRRMDLARMANVALYTSGRQRDGEFYVSRIWLE